MAIVAHKVSDKHRTNDVLISENISFDGLLLSENVLNGLKNAGFIKPSPIQLKAIPLGRCGLDLIVQAKSGTGKTCVFSVIALESICTDSSSTQVLVLAPTREIAVQIWEVMNSIGSAMKGLECHTFIGGLPLHEDRVKLKKCHIAVGSPGRIKQLIETGVLRTENIRMFILDEADKLLEEGFQEQINWIYSTLPENKQMLALSATYPEYLADHLTAYMRNPTFLRLNISDPALLGIRQYYQSVTYHPLSHVVFEEKCKILINLLSSVSFQQCLVFSNVQTRASNLADMLTNKGWPTACIAGCLDQKDRNHAMAKLKTYKCRILISTDLTARGIDADRVNMVINMDIPKDHETYLHRIGRAGRFGAFGIAISLVSEGQEKMNMNMIEKRCNTTINPLPDPLPTDLAKAQAPVYLNDVVSTEVISTDSKEIKNQDTDVNRSKSTEDTEDSQKHKPTKEDEHNDLKSNSKKDVQLVSNNVDQAENVEDKKDFTLYDLGEGSRNGLHFTEDKDTFNLKQTLKLDRDIAQRCHDKALIDTVKDFTPQRTKSSPKTAPLLVEHVNSPAMEDTNLSDNTQETSVTCDTASITKITAKSSVNETPKVDLTKLKTSSDQKTVTDVYTFPKHTDINLSKIFKHSTGYKGQKNVLTYSTASQSLKEFKENFSGYTTNSTFSVSKNAADEEAEELLRVAVTQLQELFDRNVTVKLEPGNLHKEASSNVTVKVDQEDINNDTSNKWVKKSASNLEKTKVDSKLPDVLTEHVQDIKTNKPIAGETSVVGEDNQQCNNKHVAHIASVLPKDRSANVPKANRPRKRFTNRFAIAHMVQPGESVFEYGGLVRNSIEGRGIDMAASEERNNIEVKGDDMAAIEGKNDIEVKGDDITGIGGRNDIEMKRDDRVYDYDGKEPERNRNQRNNVDEYVRGDSDASLGLSNGNHTSNVPDINGNVGVRDQIPKNRYDFGEMEKSLTFLRKTSENGSFNLRKETKSSKEISHTNITKEYTSDSESDSTSGSDTSESSDEEMKQDYRRANQQDNSYKQRGYQEQSQWQYGHYPYQPYVNFQGRPPGVPIPDYQSYYRGYPPYYQEAPSHFPYSPYYDPQGINYWPYGNNYREQNNVEEMNYHMKTSMERCLNEQREYIRLMSKSATSNEKSKSKARSKKKKSIKK